MLISRSNKKIIGITIGDPGGIGPEVILKSFQCETIKRHLTDEDSSNVFFVCIGSLAVLKKAQDLVGSNVTFNVVPSIEGDFLKKNELNVLDVSDPVDEYVIAKINAANAKLSLAAVETAAALAVEKKLDAIVTAPINKEACQLLRPGFTGHTELLAEIDGAPRFAMMLCGKMLRVVLVTTHIPLKKVSEAISKTAIVEKIVLVQDYLKDRMNITRPRIGVAGLNPHAGEGGRIGTEEQECIIPAIEEAQAMDINVSGVYPPDVIFHRAYNGDLDAIVAMYHDQGLAPLKMIAFESGINVTLGLSFVRTSPDHGTAFDIAYQNKAHVDSMRNAIEHALQLTQ